MRCLTFVVASFVVCVAVEARAETRVRLLDSELAAPTALPERGVARSIDDGGGGGAVAYALEGAASFGVGAVLTVGIGLVVAALSVVAFLLGFVAPAAMIREVTTYVLAGSLIAGLAVPLLTSMLVTRLAADDGARPNFWAVYLASVGSRVAAVGLYLLIQTAVGDSLGLGYALLAVNAVLPPIVEVVVANSFGDEGAPARAATSEVLREPRPAVDRRETMALAPTRFGFGGAF